MASVVDPALYRRKQRIGADRDPARRIESLGFGPLGLSPGFAPKIVARKCGISIDAISGNLIKPRI